MRKVIVIILSFLSIIALFLRFGTMPLIKNLGLEPRAGIRVESNKKTQVYLNEKRMGETPYQDENLIEGEYLVALKDSQSTSSAIKESTPSSSAIIQNILWQGYVKLNKGTLTVVNRELQDTKPSSSGEVINLEPGKGVTVVSTPTSALVIMDGQEIGRTPVTVTELSSGEHQFIISKENFLKRSIRATLVEGYNLTLSVDLAVSEVDLSKIPTVPILETKQVIVKNTPTGFLRIRSAASINATEVTRVKPQDVLILLEELPNWQRVRTEDGKEGFVSSAYTQKKTQ